MSVTQQVPDLSGLGKKGLPMHYQAFGIEPPMKTVRTCHRQPRHDDTRVRSGKALGGRGRWN
jgi:hypothetical protein